MLPAVIVLLAAQVSSSTTAATPAPTPTATPSAPTPLPTATPVAVADPYRPRPLSELAKGGTVKAPAGLRGSTERKPDPLVDGPSATNWKRVGRVQAGGPGGQRAERR